VDRRRGQKTITTAGTDAARNIANSIAEERLAIEKRERLGATTTIRSRMIEQEVPIEQMLRDETIEVERVSMDQVVEKEPSIRHDGNTIIVPVVEERLIKQLVLKEEIHLTKRTSEQPYSETVTLRHNVVDVDEEPAG